MALSTRGASRLTGEPVGKLRRWIGLDTIRAVIDEFDTGVDDYSVHWDFVWITINMRAVRRKARALMNKSRKQDRQFYQWEGGALVTVA